MYPWKTVIHIDKAAPMAVYLQLAKGVIEEITAGRLQPGQRLPGSRALAGLLSLNRKTVVLAFEELAAQGWIAQLPAKGTFVSQALPISQYQPLDNQANGNEVSPVETGFDLYPLSYLPAHSPERYSGIVLTDGSPDVRLAPMDALYKHCRTFAQTQVTARYLTYGDVAGERTLRHELAQYLQQTRGLVGKTENILITRGSQMAIYLILSALLRNGDHVLVGESSYPVVNDVVHRLGGNVLTVPVDDKGIDVEAIEAVCQKTPFRALYLTPHHHYPTTVTLSAERRIRLLRLAEEYRFAIIEDDYDYDFHYASSPLLPMASLDRHGVVIYIGSFSKIIAPAVRVGYLVAPVKMIESLVKLRKIVDRQGDFVMERAIAEMIRSGELNRHLKKALKTYRERRDYFCELLEKELGEWVTFRQPDGGMAVWVNFSPTINLKTLAQILIPKGIILNLHENWLAGENGLRMGFASLTKAEIAHGLRVIREAIIEQKTSED